MKIIRRGYHHLPSKGAFWAAVSIIAVASTVSQIELNAFAASQSKSLNPIESALKTQKCDVYRDDQQVLHVRAQKAKDLTPDLSTMACMGYAHGSDRTFQMDYLRHVYQGRKSEWIGSGGIKVDFFMKMLDLDGRAKKIFSDMNEEQRTRLWAYTFGVNRGFQKALQNGIWEYKELGEHPEAWEPHHTIAMILLQSFDQTNRGFRRDIEELEWKKKFGDVAESLFTQDGLPWDTTVLKEGEYTAKPSSKTNLKKKSSSADLPRNWNTAWRESMPETQIGLGSNNWILSKSHSETGHSFLANDPHLGLKYPPFWHWIHLEGAEGSDVDLIGASLPGVPIVASGANRNLAWGLTNSYLKAGDVSAVLESELKDSESVRPLIWIRWWKFQLPFFFKTYRITHQGWPILPLDTAPKGRAFVMRWSGFSLKASDFEVLSSLIKMKSVQNADEVLSKMAIPSWNFVFSDIKGNIGYRAVGKAPKNTESNPFGVQNKTLQELGTPETWEFLSSNEMPHAINPKRGWLVTANNRHFPMNSALHGGRAYIESFRASRIEELLKAKPKHGFKSISEVQCDVKAVDAPYFVPKLLEFLKSSSDQDSTREDFYQDLKEWDFQVTTDCQICSLYRRWMDLILEKTGYDEGALFRELNRDLTHYSAVLSDALLQAQKDLHFEENSELPTWGEIHHAQFGHISEDPRLEDDQYIETPGDAHTVNPGLMKWRDGYYSHIWGASQRMTVEMTNPPTVFNIFPGTNFSTRERKLDEVNSPWNRWKNCEQVKMKFPLDWSQAKSEEVQL